MADDRLSILALSAYHGGPRQEFLEGLAAHSRHEFLQMVLPPRTRHWRLRGSALHFASEIARLRRHKVDLVLATDLVDTARLRALLPAAMRGVPIVQYFHDDMLSGNLKDRPRDEPLALAQLYSILASNLVLVAGSYHRRAILAGAGRMIRSFPDAVPAKLEAAIEKCIRVLPPGVDVQTIRRAAVRKRPDGPPIILWNNPWTEDQDPKTFFETLYHLEAEGLDFRLIAVGATVRKYPEVFQEARRQLSGRILQFGYLVDRDRYLANIRAADIVVSTTRQEWFPLATVEAVIAGAWPLVGRRPANEEVFGDQLSAVGYRGPVDLRRRLARLLAEPPEVSASDALRATLAERYDWASVAEKFDHLAAATRLR